MNMLLGAFLSDPARPPGTLRYHELQGFLFAVASAPELIQPSEWMPLVFGGASPEYASLDEAKRVAAELLSLYNSVNDGVRAETAALPADCVFRDDVLANLDAEAPIGQWSRGFMRGHQWLEELWESYVPNELDEEFAAMLLTLSFFASPDIAEAFGRRPRRTSRSRRWPRRCGQYSRRPSLNMRTWAGRLPLSSPRAPGPSGLRVGTLRPVERSVSLWQRTSTRNAAEPVAIE